MGCPCANPPGTSSKTTVLRPVPRDPTDMTPLTSKNRLSRDDLRKGRFVTSVVDKDPAPQAVGAPPPSKRRRARLGGFLMRERRR